MRIAFGSDDADHEVVSAVTDTLRELGHTVVHPPSHGGDWVAVGVEVGRLVADREARLGVVCCWTGTGVSIAANKVLGVRAALCSDEEIAEGSRLYNHANVLALAMSRLDGPTADAVVRRWLRTPTGGEYRASVERLDAMGVTGAAADA